MFNINPAATFVAAVPLSVPGLAKPVEVKVTFRHKNFVQMQDFLARAKPGEDDAERLDEVVADWEGLIDSAGNAVPYSVSALRDLITNYSPARHELQQAYLRELTEAKRKN